MGPDPVILEVFVNDVTKLEALLMFTGRNQQEAEKHDLKRTGDVEGSMVVTCDVKDVALKFEMLASHRTVAKVEELPPACRRQQTGNRKQVRAACR